ncbi:MULTISPECIES: pyrimidine-nucleoside phosphorylase [unclassified Paenibacillus]|uniref:pyrimidine-nucleoside phosphorylase n=1 Tax=unclassified Paenibacillus TaxID=185978 RepID=UPI002F42492F
MRAYDIIAKKRDGGKLSKEEIHFFVDGYTKGAIPDYQASALNMAIYFQGLDTEETAELTMAMVQSGDQFDLSGIKGTKVDKHSTGGVGDTTTLVLGPWVAAAGAPMAKMSGRGLGHTGGTLDKLEAIPGFNIEMNAEQFIEAVNKIGVAVVGQTGNLVPADKKLYALRDVTATVESIPLIAGSIMSKKIAAGADAIVLDVKVGSGAFMKTIEDAFELAHTLVSIGEQVGRKTVAVITSMDQPLGYAVGNTLEVQEAIATLQGKGPQDLQELCIVLGGQMLQLAQVVDSAEAGERRMQEVLDSGAALAKLREMIAWQQGDAAVVEDPGKLPQASITRQVLAPKNGYVGRIEAEQVGLAAMIMGAGRATKDDIIDYGAGIMLRKKVGDAVSQGECMAELYTNREDSLQQAEEMVLAAYEWTEEQPATSKLVYGIVTSAEEKRF